MAEASASGGNIGKFLGNTVGEAAAFAAGLAIGPLLEPILQALRNETWGAYPDRPVGADVLAHGVAAGHITRDVGASEARLTGISGARFDELVTMAREGPGVASGFELWRRKLIDDGQFIEALTRARIEPEWIAELEKLKTHVLDPSIIAVAVQRGLIPNEGILPVGPPVEAGAVPPMPTVGIDPFDEAEGSGVDSDRLKVLSRIVGLPASPDLAARMVFRGIIERVDFDRAISEGNTRNEWAPFLFEGFRQILTAHDYIEGRLRDWITDDQMYAGTALHGMSKADTELMFKVQGRPISFHQVHIGHARGGVYDGPLTGIEPGFLKSLRESNIRPEWYNLAWAQRYNYPSAFVLRALTQAGDLTQADTEQILLYVGWEPKLAKQVSVKWAAGKAGTARDATAANLRAEYEGAYITRAQLLAGLTRLGYDAQEAELLADLGDAARVKKYRDAVVTATYKAFLAHDAQAADVRSTLTADGISSEAIDELLRLWTLELSVARKQLTPTQIGAAYRRATLSEADALAALAAHGFSDQDARVQLGLALPLLTVAQIEAALKAGTITRDEAHAQLTGQGYSDAQATELVDTVAPPTVAP